jgi:hypothetical protein
MYLQETKQKKSTNNEGCYKTHELKITNTDYTQLPLICNTNITLSSLNRSLSPTRHSNLLHLTH